MKLSPSSYSLRIRLIASVVAIEVIMLSLLVWTNLSVIQQAHADRLQDTADSILQQVATTTGRYLLEVDYASLEAYLKNLLSNQELEYLLVLDLDDNSVFSFGETPQSGFPSIDTHPSLVEDGTYDVSAGIFVADRYMGRVLIGFSLQRMNQAVNAARIRSLAIASSEILLTILVTIILGIRLTRRLGMLANAAKQVGGGNYDVEVPVSTHDEVGITAEAFNQMVQVRKQAEKENQLLLQGNRYLIHKSLAVQEEERRHVSRELHDELGQSMTAIQADAELITSLSHDRDPKIEASARAILDITSHMYDVVHSMMQQLRPSVLDDLGLVAAIQDEVKAWQARHPEIKCTFTHSQQELALGEYTSINLFRIVQESLTNIAKHANASQVEIRLEQQPVDENDILLRLEIEDDGQGVNLGDPRQGLGLLGIRERMESLNGKLVIQSSPGEGMKIQASILVPETAN